MNPLVIATHNEGKVKEFAELLSPFGMQAVSAGSLKLPEPEETGGTFAQNAAIKAQSAATLSCHWALADDSGLCVVGLEGAPGIYSARWAGAGKDFTVAFERIRSELAAKRIEPEGAAAYFICSLCLVSPQGETQFFEGRVDGTLTFSPRGEKGFGYDPIFVPAGDQRTFAQMSSGEKHAMSHRARAVAAFTDYLARRKAS